MAEFTNTSYLTIIKVALVPAVMYYLTVLVFVHYEAQKYGLKGQPKENLPRIMTVIKKGLHFIVPVLILIYVLVSNYSPMMAGFVAVVSTLAISIAANLVQWALADEKRVSLFGFGMREFKLIVKALENGAKNAIMVSVACAAAGIIVGMVSLTGMGLKFSSLVLELSFGIKALAILLIGGASLVLGMGLPVTASYIVLATLAGPALLDMGVPIMVAHMIVFWYSQDANVTPPVSLASFAGAGIAKANPMKTALTSWKLAKGIYIIPIIMAYRPLLGMGKTYELLHWEVILTMVTTTLGLVAFASAIERYFLRKATLVETLLFWVAAVGLFWPEYWADAVGFLFLILALALQKFYVPPSISGTGR
jgi:TRAP transporter 4TM/12TM fusion protein